MRTEPSVFLRGLFLFAFVAFSAVLAPSSSHAQAGHISGPVRFDAHLGLGWRGGVGPGFRLDIPLSRDGLISSVNDELALTLGADFLFHSFDRHDHHHHHDGDLNLLFPIAAQWNFILSQRWTIFPELGLAIEHHNEHTHVLPNVAFGARWLFGSHAALLLRLTHPGMFQIGITW